MSRRVPIPQRPVTIVTENGDEAMIASVKQTADQALATGQTAQDAAANAQQMVRNRDGRLAAVETSTLTLQQLADDYRARLAESIADRQAIHDRQVEQQEATAHLADDLAAETAARTAAAAAQADNLAALTASIEQLQRTPGPDGKSAYQVARAHGYGGTETQWLTTLKGDPGKDGTSYDPAVVAAIAARVTALEGVSRTTGFGLAATPALALLATTDVTVVLSRTMPNTDYTVELARAGGITVDMLTLKTKTRTAVTYTLKATLAIGASVIGVIGYYP